MSETNQDLVEFLKKRSLLGVLDERVLAVLSQFFVEVSYPQGQVVFRQGDETDGFYIIKAGLVEVKQGEPRGKAIATLEAGECFGEMAAFNERKRTATISCLQPSTILKLPSSSFDELQAYFPEVRTALIKLIDQRLASKPDKDVSRALPSLQGNLSLFDLPTVIQTVVGPKQVGTLTLRSRIGKLSARISVCNGKIMQVTFGHLNGESALYELLTHNVPMDFVFEQHSLDSIVAVDRQLSSKEPYMLLIEAARRADELPKLMIDINWPNAVYKQAQPHPNWSIFSPAAQIIARKIWLLLDVGLTIQHLSEKLPFDRYSVLTTLSEMHNKGVVKPKERQPLQTKEAKERLNFEIAELTKSLNSLVASLSMLLGKNKVSLLLKQALDETSSEHTHLVKMAIDPQTLNMEMTASSVELSDASLKALRQLSLNILWSASQANKPEGK